MGWGVSSDYLQQKQKLRSQYRTKTATPVIKRPPASKTIHIQATVVEGGGRTSYSMKSHRVTFFRSTQPNTYHAEVPEGNISYFYSGRTIQVSCGCGGGKRTTLQIL